MRTGLIISRKLLTKDKLRQNSKYCVSLYHYYSTLAHWRTQWGAKGRDTPENVFVNV